MKAAFFAVLGLFSLATAVALGQTPAPFDYYPLQVGNRWEYLATNKSAADAKPKLVTIAVDRPEIYKQVVGKDKKTGTDIEQKHVGFLLKSTSEGKITYDHVVVLPTGVYRVSIGATPENPAVVLKPPVQFFKLPLKDGETWECNSSTREAATIKGFFACKSEDVRVPFGEFKNAVVISYRDGPVDNPRLEIDYWFAKDVGMVKQRIKEKGNEMILELKDFKKAK